MSHKKRVGRQPSQKIVNRPIQRRPINRVAVSHIVQHLDRVPHSAQPFVGRRRKRKIAEMLVKMLFGVDHRNTTTYTSSQSSGAGDVSTDTVRTRTADTVSATVGATSNAMPRVVAVPRRAAPATA